MGNKEDEALVSIFMNEQNEQMQKVLKTLINKEYKPPEITLAAGITWEQVIEDYSKTQKVKFEFFGEE